jgi:hypothetical protein
MRKSWIHGVFLLLILLFSVSATTQPASPLASNTSIIVYSLRNIPKRLCVGDRIVVDYAFSLSIIPGKAPSLISNSSISVTFEGNNGDILPPTRTHPFKGFNTVHKGNFSFTATEAGRGRVGVLATIGDASDYSDETFTIEECPKSIHSFKQNNIGQGPVVIMNTYGITGEISADKEGKVTGSGGQSVWADILPYSEGDASCTHSPPWEGSAGISYTGTTDEDGSVSLTLSLDALAVNSTTLTCTDPDSSGSTNFPGYTYPACEVTVPDVPMGGGSLDAQFNCPGSEPYDVHLTVTPRRET